MASSTRSRRRSNDTNFWPGFVDAMATLLLVFTFLLSLFMLTQFYVSQELSGKDDALNVLNTRISQITQLLALERAKKKELENNFLGLTASLGDTKAETERLQSLLDLGQDSEDKYKQQFLGMTSELDNQKKISNEALARVELLNQQMAALRRQLATLNEALDAAETRESQSQTRIADLGKRLNLALARKVQELSRYRSDFFGKLRKVLGQRQDIKIVGDRFVFQSEVLFTSGAAELSTEGLPELDNIANAIITISQQIPPDIDWILRVDGHTDKNPINSPQFPSNWEISSARAISVVRYLVQQGVPPHRVTAAGFGEFQPIDYGDEPKALRRNRRIEFKLTTR